MPAEPQRSLDACGLCGFRSDGNAYLAVVRHVLPTGERVGVICWPCARAVGRTVAALQGASG